MKTTLADPRLLGIGASSPEAIKKNTQQALQDVAVEFESLFFREMLKSMRQAGDVLAADGPFNSREQQFVRDWHDMELSQTLAEGGGMGLAQQLVRQVEAMQPALSDPLS